MWICDTHSDTLFAMGVEKNASRPTPSWMTKDTEKMSVIVDRLPDRADIDFDVAEHLIVELYSK